MILGGLIPLVARYATTRFPAAQATGTWADPLAPRVFIGLSAAVALAHLLVAFGYDSIGDRSKGGAARSCAQLAALGLLLACACEIASAVLATAPRHSEPIAQLHVGYAVATALIVAGTLGAGLALITRWPMVALPLLVIGVYAVIAVAPMFVLSMTKGADAPQVAAVTGWNVLNVWLGLAMLWKPKR